MCWYVSKHHEQSGMLVRNNFGLGWFWLWCWRPFNFNGGISETGDVIMCDRFCAIWSVKLCKATSNVVDRIISLFIVLNKSDTCCGELSPHGIVLELLVCLNVSSATWGKLRADAIIISMNRFVTESRRKNVVFIVCGVGLLALHLPFELLGAVEYLKHKVIL
jgi:hypothetical protein